VAPKLTQEPLACSFRIALYPSSCLIIGHGIPYNYRQILRRYIKFFLIIDKQQTVLLEFFGCWTGGLNINPGGL